MALTPNLSWPFRSWCARRPSRAWNQSILGYFSASQYWMESGLQHSRKELATSLVHLTDLCMRIVLCFTAFAHFFLGFHAIDLAGLQVSSGSLLAFILFTVCFSFFKFIIIFCFWGVVHAICIRFLICCCCLITVICFL